VALNLDISTNEDIVVVRCRGRIVFGEEADELRRIILDLVKKSQRIVLNCAWVEYIDSTGLGVLVASLISARHHGAEIKLAALGSRARQVLTIARMDRLFAIYDSADEAITSFRYYPDTAAG